MEPLSVRYGRYIRLERTRQHLSQEELAQRAGCTKLYITRLENAQNPHTQLTKAIDVAKALDIRPQRLGRLLLGV